MTDKDDENLDDIDLDDLDDMDLGVDLDDDLDDIDLDIEGEDVEDARGIEWDANADDANADDILSEQISATPADLNPKQSKSSSLGGIIVIVVAVLLLGAGGWFGFGLLFGGGNGAANQASSKAPSVNNGATSENAGAKSFNPTKTKTVMAKPPQPAPIVAQPNDLIALQTPASAQKTKELEQKDKGLLFNTQQIDKEIGENNLDSKDSSAEIPLHQVERTSAPPLDKKPLEQNVSKKPDSDVLIPLPVDAKTSSELDKSGEDKKEIAKLEGKIKSLEGKVQDLEEKLNRANKKIDEAKKQDSKQVASHKRSKPSAQKQAKRSNTKVATKVAKPKPHHPKWVLRSASNGRAMVSIGNSGDIKAIAVGSTLSGVGRIKAIEQESNGKWIVRGTSGSVRQ